MLTVEFEQQALRTFAERIDLNKVFGASKGFERAIIRSQRSSQRLKRTRRDHLEPPALRMHPSVKIVDL